VRVLLSHASDGVVNAIWPRHDVDAESCWQWHYRGDLATAECRCRVMLAIMLSSHASDGATDMTWPRRDVDAESCCRVMLVTALLRRLGRGVM
jgi:hypothetical protein